MNTKEIILLDFNKNIDKFLILVKNLINELEENSDEQKVKPIESSLIDRENRKNIYKTWLETNSIRREEFDNLCKSVEKAKELFEMKLEEMMDTVAERLRKLNTNPYTLMESLMKLKEAHKILEENPQITKEEYLSKMGIEED